MREPPPGWLTFGRAAGFPAVQLRPFTLGHAFLLERLGLSALPDLETECGLGGLALMLAACSRPYQRATKLLNSWRGRWIVYWSALRFLAPVSRLVGRLQFQQYLISSWGGLNPLDDFPALLDNGHPLHLILSVLSRRGYSDEAALDLPVARALAEARGVLVVDAANIDANRKI
jgi:hypothetical protein